MTVLSIDDLTRTILLDPELLEFAAEFNKMTTDMIFQRRHEVHLCLRCGGLALVALVYTVPDLPALGHRWLDLCGPCAHLMTCDRSPETPPDAC